MRRLGPGWVSLVSSALFVLWAPAPAAWAFDQEPEADEEAAKPARAAAVPQPPVAPLSRASTSRSLGAVYEVDLLRDLPMSYGVWSLFETIESTAILDRLDAGGLHVGEAGLMGIRGSSWTQATWLLGEMDVTDPDRAGTPLFLADPLALETIEITSGVPPADFRGSGPTVQLGVRRPGDSWRKAVQASFLPTSLQQSHRGSQSAAPAIAHHESYDSLSFRADGPLLDDRLGLLVSGVLSRGGRRERDDPNRLRGRDSGWLAHAVFKATPRDEIRVLGTRQDLSHPYAGRTRFLEPDVRQSDHLTHVQATWRREAQRPWSLTGGFVRGSFDPHLPAEAGGTVERLSDGPVQQQFGAESVRTRLSLSGRLDPITSAHHALRLGASFARTRSTTRPSGLLGPTPETVNGLPARVWEYGWAGPSSRWLGAELVAYAADQMSYGPLSVEAGLRYESSRGSAPGSGGEIHWHGLAPRLLARVRPFGGDGLAFLAGYSRHRYRLPLNLLAYGDPSAAQGRVYRWLDVNQDGAFQTNETGVLVARVGPGGPVASIDPRLKAPRSKEVFVGLESRVGAWHFRGLAYHRREQDFVTSVNLGAPSSAYDVSYLPDPGDDIVGDGDDWLLPVYNRRPESFGLDRYLLTNDPEKGTNKGLEVLIAGKAGSKLRFLVGATASKSFVPVGYRGFLAIENDHGLVGERLEAPNATTLSKGRPFFERGYNLKVAATYRAPFDVRLGAVARYQDGQHFARLVIPSGLNQGPEPIRGIYNGDSRFTYVLTIDARVEKGVRLGPMRVAGVLEAFNLRGTAIEVEEDVIWSPSYRVTSAVQPPRVIRLGMRLDF